jgi:putative ABC transport system permease protein
MARLDREVAGLAIGLSIAVGLSRFVESLLYEVSPVDQLTMTAGAVIPGLVAAAACALPARRALAVSRIAALRG